MTAGLSNASNASSAKGMPLLYNSVVPLTSSVHRNLSLEPSRKFGFASSCSGIPVTLDEVAIAQADYPIVFSAGDEPSPLILTGLPDGGNQFVDAAGNWRAQTYIPAYVRRYPFLLAKTDGAGDTLTLCVDLSSDRIKKQADDGNLFSSDDPTPVTKKVLKFCEQFEISMQRTRAVMGEFRRLDLLIDGQAEVRPQNGESSTFRGFQIISQERLQKLAGFEAAKLVKSGGMVLVYAHLFSIRHLERLIKV